MRSHHVMFMGLILAAGTLISLTFGGLWLGTQEVAVANAFTVFKQANILGIWSITIPNVSFFLVGAKALMMMDFAFFQGSWALVQWISFLVLGLGLMWGIFTVAIGVINGLFRRA